MNDVVVACVNDEELSVDSSGGVVSAGFGGDCVVAKPFPFQKRVTELSRLRENGLRPSETKKLSSLFP